MELWSDDDGDDDDDDGDGGDDDDDDNVRMTICQTDDFLVPWHGEGFFMVVT